MKLRGKRCGVREKLERRKPNRAGLEFLLSSDYLWPLTPKFTFLPTLCFLSLHTAEETYTLMCFEEMKRHAMLGDVKFKFNLT